MKNRPKMRQIMRLGMLDQLESKEHQSKVKNIVRRGEEKRVDDTPFRLVSSFKPARPKRGGGTRTACYTLLVRNNAALKIMDQSILEFLVTKTKRDSSPCYLLCPRKLRGVQRRSRGLLLFIMLLSVHKHGEMRQTLPARTDCSPPPSSTDLLALTQHS